MWSRQTNTWPGAITNSSRRSIKMLDVSVGLNRYDISLTEKQAAYACDVTYGADQEFGFDYLRDQLRLWSQPKEAPGLHFRAILRGRELPKH